MPNLSSRPVRRLVLLALLAGAASLGSPTQAQIGAGALPDGLTSAQTLNPAQTESLQAFLRQHVEGLSSGDMARVQAARDALLAPLEQAGVSVAFRLGMSSVLAPVLADLAAGANEHTAFNALRLAGALATDASVDTIRKSLSDKRSAVRYGAALAARMTIDGVTTKRTSVPLDALLSAIQDALRNESDPGVYGGLIAAMEAIDPTGPGRVRAMSDLAGITAERLATAGAVPSPEWARAYVRAVGAAQSSLLNQLQTGAPDAAFANNLALLSGQALAFSARRLGDAQRPMTEAERQPVRDLVASAEVSLLFVDSALRGRRHKDQAIVGAFDGGLVSAMVAEINKWIGEGGFLTQAPYNIPADRFRLPQG